MANSFNRMSRNEPGSHLNMNTNQELESLPDVATILPELTMAEAWDSAAVSALIRSKSNLGETPAFLFLGKKEALLLQQHLGEAFGAESVTTLHDTYYMGRCDRDRLRLLRLRRRPQDRADTPGSHLTPPGMARPRDGGALAVPHLTNRPDARGNDNSLMRHRQKRTKRLPIPLHQQGNFRKRSESTEPKGGAVMPRPFSFFSPLVAITCASGLFSNPDHRKFLCADGWRPVHCRKVEENVKGLS